MRKFKLLFTLLTVLIVGSLGFMSCNDDDGGEKTPPVKPLTVSPENISFDKSVSARYINVTTTGTSWNAEVTPTGTTWLSIAKEEGRILVTTNAANVGVDSRVAVITVTSDSSNEPITIEVTQFGSKGEIKTNPESLAFDAIGNSPKDVSVITNVNSWSVTLKETEDASWLSVTKGDEKITVSVTDKTTVLSRSGTIVLSSPDMEESVEIEVVQSGMVFSFSTTPIALSFNKDGNTPLDVTITTNIPSGEWSVAVADTDKGWITATKNANLITVSVTDRAEIGSRTGKIIFTSVHLEQAVEFTVNQRGLPQVITYGTAEGYYYGNIDGTGTGSFIIDISSNGGMIGLLIDGYSALTNDLSSFVVSSGQYSVSETSGAINTLIKGGVNSNGGLIGSFSYDFTAFKCVFGREGMKVDVVHNAGNYEITANVYGEDLDGNIQQDIIIKYSGPITFADGRTPFEIMPVGSYKFDATPHNVGINTWTTAMTKDSDYLIFAGFAEHESFPLFVDYVHEKDGNIVKSFYPDTVNDYGPQGSAASSGMRYCYVVGQDVAVLNKGGSVNGKWDDITQTLVFGDATINDEGTNYDLMLGLFVFDAAGNPVGMYSDFYKTMKAKYQPPTRSTASVGRYMYPKLSKFNMAPATSVKNEKKVDTFIKLAPINNKRYTSFKTIEFDPSKVTYKQK